MNPLTFINDQLLKMEWLFNLVTSLLKDIIGMDPSTKLYNSVHFFIYDTIKIFILLIVLIFTISVIQSYFPPERTKRILGRFNGITANILGALLGTITPFCSCSSIPLFIGFTNAGLPIGVTFSFLISSPLVDLASVIMLASIFNVKIALAYVIVGLILAVVGGSLISVLKLEKYVEAFVYKNKMEQAPDQIQTMKDRFSFGRDQVLMIIRKVWIYILAGVFIGAMIHNYLPDEWINMVLGEEKWYSVFIATFSGVPMYADIFGTLPIAESLLAKSVGLGTILSFMMAVTALSLPSMILLKNVVKTKLLLIFASIVVTGILLIGILFNTYATLFI